MDEETLRHKHVKQRSVSFPISVRHSSRSVRLLTESNFDEDGQAQIRLSFIASFLKISSFLFIIPFKVVRNVEEESLRLIPRKWMAKVLCLLLQLFQGCFIIQAMKDALDEIENKVEAWAVLAFISHIFDIILQVLTFCTFWFSRKELQVLLNKLEECARLSKKENREERTHSSNWIFKLCEGPEAVLVWAYAALLITGLQSTYKREMVWNASSSIVGLILPFAGWARTYITYPFCSIVFFVERLAAVVELNILSGALSMYEIGRQFQSQVADTTTPVKLMEEHKNVRNIFNRFNKIFGRLLLSHYVCTLLTYVAMPAMLTKMRFSMDKLISKVVYMGLHTVTYLSSCEVHSMIKDSVMDWIHESKLRKEILPVDLIKLGILSSEVESQPVGVSCNFFIVSYGLMGTFLGLLATYSIFAWQMQAHGLK